VGTVNHVLVAIALVSGLGCLLAPWDRIPDWVFVGVPAAASAEVALTVWAAGRHGPVYEWFYVLVAVFAAYAFESRRQLVVQMAFPTLAACVPLFYRADLSDELARLAVLIPMLWVATAVVAQLREQMVARQRDLAELARRDPLTGVGNRRLMQERLDYELSRHRRSEQELALLVLDLDGFKEVNDRLGHPAGDQLLAGVAQALCDTVREGDTIVRHGGDEFCILAPDTGRLDIEALAGRIHVALATIDCLGRPLSATIGVAVHPHDGPTAELLLAAADAAERDAKSGRHHSQLSLDEPPRLHVV
jgi:diguanylate cyclase (GGDEF)-like protein